MVRHFWWGQVKEEKKLAWMNWDKMCLSKEKGWMGFRDLKTFNLALLANRDGDSKQTPRLYSTESIKLSTFQSVNVH